MTHPTSSEDLPRSDDVCLVCGTIRVNHGDMNHIFSLDGNLVVNKPGPEPKMQAPNKRPGDEDMDSMTQELAKSMELNAVMRLTEVLIDKGLLDGKDTMYIFSGYKS